ncbi:hypothetical protein ACFUC2_04950 [[Kitasatospora] papulosa]|uniref:hypothetical protein n=1 Tax=Streptomyces TaxID=1883 RepID=UPI00331E888C
MTTSTPPFILHIEGQRVPARSRAELEAENARLRNEVTRLRAGEEPADVFQPITTGGQFLWVLGHANPDVRQRLADQAVRALEESARCVVGDHEPLIRYLRTRNARLQGVVDAVREEAQTHAQTSSGAGRGVALAIGFRLAQSNAQVVL